MKVKNEKILVRPSDIKPSSEKFEILSVMNPGVNRLKNGDVILYVRVIERLKKWEDKNYCYSPRYVGKKNNQFKIKIDKFSKKSIRDFNEVAFEFKNGTKRLTFISHFRKVILDKKGEKIKSMDNKPSFFGLSWDGELGVEDARITKIGDLYVMTYVSLSKEDNISTSYAISNDCLSWYRRGIIFKEQNKDVVLFPEMIEKRYVAFNRPEGNFQFSPPHIWISFSKDLEHWGDSDSVRITQEGQWDYGRIGAGPPPIKTKDGWLLIYHAVREKKEDAKNEGIFKKIFAHEKINMTYYYASAALFDLNNPKKILKKAHKPILSPTKKHQKSLFEDKRVIFPTGMVVNENKKEVLIYSGAGDGVTTFRKILISEIMETLKPVKWN
jgi:beta-1,2-mannobiose phosphorylase / 1,2-beta-oligomannan phosphorylase